MLSETLKPRPAHLPRARKQTKVRSVQLEKPIDKVVQSVMNEGHTLSSIVHAALYSYFSDQIPDFKVLAQAIELRTGLWNGKAGAAK